MGFSLNNPPKNTQLIDFLGKSMYRGQNHGQFTGQISEFVSAWAHVDTVSETILGTHIDPLQESNRS
jgi:hypothetical protein